MQFEFDDAIKKRFNNLGVGMVKLTVASNIPKLPIDDLKDAVYNEVRSKYNLINLKNNLNFRLNRDFFWSIGIDPTKKRPASEALIRRILRGKEIPHINIFVDLYNLISIKHEIAIAGFDYDKVSGKITMQFATPNQKFLGIGMKTPKLLSGNEIILTDETNRIIAIYPYRDADYSKLSNSTKNLLLLTCGVPGLLTDKLIESTVDLYNTFKKYLNAKGNYTIFQINE
ncbi:MAG: B3/B4 domain-containing protein [Candidatus Helarchaeota archaeon]